MANSSSTLHLVFAPFLAPGHFIPMIDMAKLIAKRDGVTATVFITPVIAARYGQTINQSESIPIRFVQVPFPTDENGLPEGCETADNLLSGQWLNFLTALDTWQASVGHFVEQMDPFPNCMITDRFVPKITVIAKKLGIRRVIFDGMGCLSLLLIHQIEAGILETILESESEEPFDVPGLPGNKIELRKYQLPLFVFTNSPEIKEYNAYFKEANNNSFGILINSFEELEHDYILELRKFHKNRAWCVGPLSLSNHEKSEMTRRGNKTSIDKNECLKWLDRHSSGSVIYVCLGTLSEITAAQMSELGRALVESNRPFILVMRETEMNEAMEKWLSEYEYEYEKMIHDKGLIVHGWAPQVLILSHKAIGGFLTHCGWNSIVEAISYGVPMITWPLFGDQFFNEKLIVDILKIGVGVGVMTVTGKFARPNEVYMLIKCEAILEAIKKVMGGEGEERKKRARELGKAAKKAIEEGGSSYNNITSFLKDMV